MSVTGSDSRPLDRASLFFERARQLALFSSGSSLELERQLREIFKALSYDNGDLKFYLLLGKIYKQNLDLTSSMFCYRFILRQTPNMIAARKFLIELLILKGKEYMLMGLEMNWKVKFTAARSCFDEALEYNRENSDLWILKSVCHVHCNELIEAYEAVSKVIKPNRDLSAEVYILRAKINWGRGLTEAGNQDIRVASFIDPDHPEVLGYIARSYAKSELLYREALHAFSCEKYKESLELVDHALHITAEDVKLYILKSRIYRMLKELQSAYEAIMTAKSIFDEKYNNEEYPMSLPPEILLQTNLILNEMAINYACEGNYHDAILLYNKILRSEEALNATLINPSSSTVSIITEQPTHSISALTNSPSKAGGGGGGKGGSNNSPSKSTHRGGPSRHYVNYKYYMNRGDCYRALNKLKDAIIDYQIAYDLANDDWTIRTKLSLSHYLIGTNYFNDSRFYEADIELTKAIQYNPKVSEYYSLRGKAKYYLSNFLGAHSDYKKVVELDPNNNEIKMRLQQFEDDRHQNSSSTSSTGKEIDDEVELLITSLTGKRSSSSPEKKPSRSSSSPTRPNDGASEKQIEADYQKELLKKTKERQEKLDQLSAKSRYTTERTIKKFEPEKEDYLEMMLHPQQSMKLPTLKLITSDQQEKEYQKTVLKKMMKKLQYTDPEQSLTMITTKDSSSAEEVILPKILTKSQFLPAHVAKMKVQQRNEAVQLQLQDRTGTERGELWKIVDTAKEIALSKTTAKLKAATNKANELRSKTKKRKGSSSEQSHQSRSLKSDTSSPAGNQPSKQPSSLK